MTEEKYLMKNWKRILFQVVLAAVIVFLIGYSLYLNKQVSSLSADNSVLHQVVITLLFPTQEVPTQKIPTTTPQYACSHPPATDWNLYEANSLDAIYHGKYGDGYGPFTSNIPRHRVQVIFEGRKYSKGKPARNDFGNAVFVFNQSDKKYDFSVSKRVESDFDLLKSGTEITVFIDTLWRGSENNVFMGKYEHIVQDYAVGETVTRLPNAHWNVVIIQNGYWLTGEDVYIKKQPFTINTYLPRSKDKGIWVLVNAFLKPQTQLFTGFNLKAECPKASMSNLISPFCGGLSAAEGNNNGERQLLVDAWISNKFWYEDCSYSTLNKVNFLENTEIFERDVLYLRVSEDDSDDIFANKVTIPVIAFTGNKLFLTFFYDVNENQIIDVGEIKTRVLHFE